jgi:hypothetical protein
VGGRRAGVRRGAPCRRDDVRPSRAPRAGPLQLLPLRRAVPPGRRPGRARRPHGRHADRRQLFRRLPRG